MLQSEASIYYSPKEHVDLFLYLLWSFSSNPSAKTIEGDLFKAMVKAGAVSKDNADDIKKVCSGSYCFVCSCDLRYLEPAVITLSFVLVF